MTAIASPSAALRTIASPYARRLARERGVGLDGLRGSGPRGRILAADVVGGRFETAEVPVQAAVSSTPPLMASLTAAMAATLMLGALRDLLAGIGKAGSDVGLEEVLLRAVALALDVSGVEAGGANAAITWEKGRSGVVVTGASRLSMRALRERTLEDGSEDGSETNAILSLKISPSSNVRRVMLPLRAGIPMRLAIAADEGGGDAEALLVFDTGRVGEDEAERLLSAMRDLLNHPLRLFV